MSDLTLVLLCAGSSSRFEMDVKKQWLRIGDVPLWEFVAQNFEKSDLFQQIIVVASSDDIEYMRHFGMYEFVIGGANRQNSLKNALLHVKTEHVLVSDVARACVDVTFLKNIIKYKNEADCIVPYLTVADTVVYKDKTINRDEVKRLQTPQLSSTKVLSRALDTDVQYTDESSAIVAAGGTRKFIKGDPTAHKITYIEDLRSIECLEAPSEVTLSGNGFDVHAFDNKGEMWLCGVKIDSDFGLKAHSDGDVAIHSLIDALLGAAGMGDIGTLFPDTDPAYKGMDSKLLLKEVLRRIYSYGFIVINVDITIAAQKPRLSKYKDSMRHTLAQILHLSPSHVNIKATTTEKLGFIGRAEGIGVWSNANLKYFNWKKN